MRKKQKEEFSSIIYLVCQSHACFYIYIYIYINFRFINDGLQPITAFCENTKIYVQGPVEGGERYPPDKSLSSG